MINELDGMFIGGRRITSFRLAEPMSSERSRAYYLTDEEREAVMRMNEARGVLALVAERNAIPRRESGRQRRANEIAKARLN